MSALSRRRIWSAVLLFTAAWGLAQPLAAGAPVAATADAAIVSGRTLEQQRNWRDAIEYYEGALKAWPENEHLSYGLRRAKCQFSIDRRYGDESFRTRLVRASRAQALDILDDLLLRVQNNFVDPISTQSLVAHGTESLWLALANEKFLLTNLPQADPASIQALRAALREKYWNHAVPRRQDARQVVGEICDLAQRQTGLTPGCVVMEYVFGACNCLDDYSNVLTPVRYADLFNNINGEFVGIGIVMEGKIGSGMELVDILPDSPAFESGLRAGEWIVAVDGVDCRLLSTEEAAGLLTGPSGSPVKLEVASGEARREIACTRREVTVKSIPIATIADAECGVAYLRLSAFQSKSTEELDAALESLQRQGMRSLIWDVRGNPGGLLPEAVSVMERFIDDGVIVSTRGRMPDQNETFNARSGRAWRMPLVLLIDENSASASEIVAGAIRDHNRGKIVGRTSFGKWSVQSIYPTTQGMGLRLTTARFYSPNGNTYSKIGIQPDVVVNLPDDGSVPRFSSSHVDLEHDPDVQAALEILCGQSYTQR